MSHLANYLDATDRSIEAWLTGRVSRMLTELETWFEEVESERLSIPKEW